MWKQYLTSLYVPEDKPISRHGTMKRKVFFPVRSAYRMLVINKHHATEYMENIAGRSDTKVEEKEWLGIWKLDVPSKMYSYGDLLVILYHRGTFSFVDTWPNRVHVASAEHRIPGNTP